MIKNHFSEVVRLFDHGLIWYPKGGVHLNMSQSGRNTQRDCKFQFSYHPKSFMFENESLAYFHHGNVLQR